MTGPSFSRALLRLLRNSALIWSFLNVGIALNFPSGSAIVYALCSMALFVGFAAEENRR